RVGVVAFGHRGGVVQERDGVCRERAAAAGEKLGTLGRRRDGGDAVPRRAGIDREVLELAAVRQPRRAEPTATEDRLLVREWITGRKLCRDRAGRAVRTRG